MPPRLVALSIAGLTLAAVGLLSPASLRVVLIDGSLAAAIIIAATGLGITILKLIRGPLEARWLLLAGAGLGLGLLALLVLTLGLLGLLYRALWLTILTISFLLALWHARGLNPKSKNENPKSLWLWLLVIPFLTLALLAATLPPGLLWSPEGNGYDVLEYHLGVPREYFDAGKITYIPHNIYSNFPFNVEMLYLLCMIIRGDAIAAAGVATLLNVLFGILAIAAIWLAAREHSPRAALFAAITAAVCPFMFYLSGIAYVENALLFFSALAFAAVLSAARADKPLTWIALAGLFAGFACGCKYTAVYSIAAPLAIAIVFIFRSQTSRPALSVTFVFCAALSFSPWLIRNIINTGNPVFPLARNIFPERPGLWDNERAAHWHDGHLPAPEDRPLPQRAIRLAKEILISSLFGPIILPAIAAGAILLLIRTDPQSRFIVLCSLTIMALGIMVWTAFTHMVGRFAITLILPASILLGVALDRLNRTALTMCAVLSIAAFNLYQSIELAQREHLLTLAPELASAGPALLLEGRIPGTAHIPVLNELAAQNHRVLMIGEARAYYLHPGIDYTVVFNRNPFAEAAAQGPAAAAQWLHANNYT